MPFSAPAVWSLARKRSCAAIATPSIVAPGPEIVRFPVEAARTGSFHADTVEPAEGCMWNGTSDDPPPGEAEMLVPVGWPGDICVDPSSTLTSRSVTAAAAGPSMTLIAATLNHALL